MSERMQDSERDEAQRLSRDCPHCEGHGIVTVYLPEYDGSAIGVRPDGERFVTRVAAHCGCRFGVWIRSHNTPEIQRRMPFVADILDGRSRWQLSDPTTHSAPAESRTR